MGQQKRPREPLGIKKPTLPPRRPFNPDVGSPETRKVYWWERVAEFVRDHAPRRRR